MKTYIFLGQKYSLVENEKDCFSVPLVEEKITDYFLPFDYIFGDFAYDKLRLKGFYDKTNKEVKEYNNIENLATYKKDHCAYGSATFLLKLEK